MMDLLAKRLFPFFCHDDLHDVIQEARLIQLERYNTLLDDQFTVHKRRVLTEAARNLGFFRNMSSLDELMDETGFEVEFVEQTPPELFLSPFLNVLPRTGKLTAVIDLVLQDELSIQAACESVSVDPKSVFTALRKIGRILDSDEETTWFGCSTTIGIRKAVERISIHALRPLKPELPQTPQLALF